MQSNQCMWLHWDESQSLRDDLVLSTTNLPGADGKFELLKDLLKEALDSKQKIVVFSQYRKMIQYIEQHCKQEKIGSISLTGHSKSRGNIVEKFQKDPETKVFIGSLESSLV